MASNYLTAAEGLAKQGYTFYSRMIKGDEIEPEEAVSKLEQSRDKVFFSSPDNQSAIQTRVRSLEELSRLASFEVDSYWDESSLDPTLAQQAKNLNGLGWQGLSGPSAYALYQALNAGYETYLKDDEETLAEIRERVSFEQLKEIGLLYRDQLRPAIQTGALDKEVATRFLESLVDTGPNGTTVEGFRFWMEQVDEPATAIQLERTSSWLSRIDQVEPQTTQSFFKDSYLPTARLRKWPLSKASEHLKCLLENKESSLAKRLTILEELDDAGLELPSSRWMEFLAKVPDRERPRVLKLLPGLNQKLFPGGEAKEQSWVVVARLQKNQDLDRPQRVFDFVTEQFHRFQQDGHQKAVSMATEVYYITAHLSPEERTAVADRIASQLALIGPTEGHEALLRLRSESVQHDLELLEELRAKNPDQARKNGFGYDLGTFLEADPAWREELYGPLFQAGASPSQLKALEERLTTDPGSHVTNLGLLAPIAEGAYLREDYRLILDSQWGQRDLQEATRAFAAIKTGAVSQLSDDLWGDQRDQTREALKTARSAFQALDERGIGLATAERLAHLLPSVGLEGFLQAVELEEPGEAKPDFTIDEGFVTVGGHSVVREL